MLGAMILFGIGVAIIGFGTSVFAAPVVVTVGLLLWGFGNGAVDVMMNVEGAAIEKQSGKTILPLFHAFFSFGTVIGAGLGVLAIAIGMNVVVHLSIIAVLIIVIAVVSIANVPSRETNLDAASDGPKLTMRERLSITMSAWREPRTYALGVILNVAAILFASGVAMRLRTMQAGPLMQMPVFLALFFAPVYVPLALLQGWIHGVATFNPLTRVLEVEPFEAMIVFVRTKQATEDVAERLRARGFSAAAINGDIPQAQRERAIAALKEGSIDILIATDVAARGLDVERISHVLNYDIPQDTESYVHRIGRTGRAGRSGAALLFVTPRERHLLKAIEKATRQKLTEAELPSIEHVNAQRVAKFRDSISDALGAPGFDLFRSMIEDYERESDVPMADIAAALALQSRDGEQFLMTEPPPERRRRDDRPERSDKPARKPGEGFATYRIDVGKRHKIGPVAIVGAIANEGGLHRSDFGHITIRPDHSLVELPTKLSRHTLKALERTRISGVLINLQPDRGPGKSRRKPK